MWRVLLLSVAASGSQSLSSLPSLYRSLVMDHFSHKHDQQLQTSGEQFHDNFFNDFDSIFTDNKKRDSIGNEIIDNAIDNIPTPPVSSKISPFVHLGGSKPSKVANIFFQPHQFSGPAGVAIGQPQIVSAPSSPASHPKVTPFSALHVPSSPSAPVTQPEQVTLPVVPHPQPQQQPQSSFSIKPFTFFSQPSGIALPPQPVALPPQPVALPQAPVSPVSVSAPEISPLAVLSPESVTPPTIEMFSFPTRDQGQNDRDNSGAMTSHDNSFSPILTGITAATKTQVVHNYISNVSILDVMPHMPPAPVSIPVINPAVNEVSEEKPFNIFEYIGRPTAEREVRKKQDMKGKKMGKMDALKMLMSIAGDSWEKDLLMGSKDDKMSGGHTGQ